MALAIYLPEEVINAPSEVAARTYRNKDDQDVRRPTRAAAQKYSNEDQRRPHPSEGAARGDCPVLPMSLAHDVVDAVPDPRSQHRQTDRHQPGGR
jgi:hypothetical protein